MARFTKPEYGNAKRLASPVNSAKNLQRKLSRQNREDPEKFAVLAASYLAKDAA